MATIGVVKDCVPPLSTVKVEGDAPGSYKKRISVHSHIKGLGVSQSIFNLDTSLISTDGGFNEKAWQDYVECFDIGCGLVGQYKAREAAQLAVDMIKAKKMAGKLSCRRSSYSYRLSE